MRGVLSSGVDQRCGDRSRVPHAEPNPAMDIKHLARGILLAAWLPACTAGAAATTREETIDGRRHLVVENAHVRLAVLPDPGGSVVEFLHKPTGTDHVHGGGNLRQGRLGGGWKDPHQFEAPERRGAWIYSTPYEAEFRSGPGWTGIFVTCTAEGRRFDREMRLADDSAELTTLIRVTNVGDSPKRLQARWHTYSTLDDQLAKHSCILAPGDGGQVRKCFIGSGWDHQFIATDGYWMAVNYANGSGMWITFRRDQNDMQITWTDYQPARVGPQRGSYIAEPHPTAVLAGPGESVEYESTFFPFTAADAPDSIPLGVLEDAGERARARGFLATVLPNLTAIGPFTMTPGTPPAGDPPLPDANRFDFGHRRRDRFSVRPWGVLDAMFDVPGVQEVPVRARFYARLFDGVTEPQKVTFRFTAADALGRVVKEHVRDYALTPAAREIDVRDDIPIADLPDGSYRFVIEGYVEGEDVPIHTYVDHQRLVGQTRPAFEAAAAAREAGPLAERPFVRALAEVPLPEGGPGATVVPIGVEDASGTDRRGWPVRLGVPFAAGTIPRAAAFELIAPAGASVPIQTDVMATWPDGSVKWLLVDFQADVPADTHVFYTLRERPAPAAAAAPLVVERDGHPAFTAGPLAAAAADRILGLFGPEDLWWTDGEGKPYFFRLEGDGAGVVIEENGPLRGVIKATGWYVAADGRRVCLGELRLEYCRGQSFAKLFHTVTFAGNPWREQLGSVGMQLRLPGPGYESASVALDGTPVSGRTVVVEQPCFEAATVVADGARSAGRHCNGGVTLAAAGRPTVAVHHVDFWQMAPKKLEADAATGTVRFSYWPTEAGAMSFLPREDGWIPNSSSAEAIAVGMGRTHEFVVDFDCRQLVAGLDAVHEEPVVAIVPPRHLARTGAMLHLAPYDPGRHPVLEKVISDTLDHFSAERELWGWYGQWFYGGLPNVWRPLDQGYKWLNFGRYAWILNEQDIAETPWLCWHRSGDRKYLAFARANTRHLMEVATIRWNPVWPEFVGFSRRHHECIWLGSGDYGHSMVDPFLDYYYATGYRPAREAAERLAEGMTFTTAGTYRYLSNPVAGLARMHLDTENPRYREHARRIWETLCYPEQNEWFLMDHGNRMVLWYSQLDPRCLELWKAWTLQPDRRGVFDGVDVLTRLWQITGDGKYAMAAAAKLPTKRPENITQTVLAEIRALCYAGWLPPDDATTAAP